MSFNRLIDKYFGYLAFQSFRNFKIREILHNLYLTIFKTKIIKLPTTLIYDLRRFPPTFGDFIHVLSIAQGLSLKFNKHNLKEIKIIFENENEFHNQFITNVALDVRKILDFDIDIKLISYEELQKKFVPTGLSIYPYLPSFYSLKSLYRNHKPIDVPILAKKIDLRIFSHLSLRHFVDKKYKKIFSKINTLIQSKYYCFVLREETTPEMDKKKFKGYQKKYWKSSKTISIIKKLIKKGENVLIINPLHQRYDLPGAIYIEESTTDILLRYFLYLNAYQVISVACGPISLLIHSNATKYIVYDQANISEAYDLKFLKKNNYPLYKDYIFDSPKRKFRHDNLEISDII